MKAFNRFLFLFLGIILVYGCAKPIAKCTQPEDNSLHHYLRGMELLEQGKVQDAEAKFDRALYCDEKYGPAHAV